MTGPGPVKCVSLLDALADSQALVALANNAGLTVQQTKAVLAWLADMPAQQLVRMTATAKADRVRAANRETRRGKR